MGELRHVLTELEDFSDVSSPLKNTNRIKFTCFTASTNFTVFGATSGGLYIFKRDTFTFIWLLPSKEGSVTHVSVSPDEKWFGFSTARGISCILEHHNGSIARRIISSEHAGSQITALLWNTHGTQLYVGDDVGRISVINITSFMGPAMFHAPAVTLMQLDSEVVQLDWSAHLLLASTLTRCYLCDTQREQYRQIGSQLRQGQFGACFYNIFDESIPNLCDDKIKTSVDISRPFSNYHDGEWLLADEHLRNVKLFCARPGSRLWEVRVDGTVLSTHQFKKLLATPPTGIIKPHPAKLPELPDNNHQDNSWPEQSFNFTVVQRVAGKFLFTFHSGGIYVFNPVTGQVVLWSDSYSNIRDAYIVGDVIYLWMGDSNIHAVTITALDKLLVRLYLQKQYTFCANLCVFYKDALMKMVPVSAKLQILSNLLDKLNHEEISDAAFIKVSELQEEIHKFAQDQNRAQMLQSGIFIVGNAHLLSSQDEAEDLIPRVHTHRSSQITRSNKFRSQNSSPDNAERNFPSSGLLRSTSRTASLPELCDNMADLQVSPAVNGCHENRNSSNEKNYDPGDPGEDSDSYDPFPDLPLSALTSPEAVAALKLLGNSISSGTKSLKEKWQELGVKFRGPEVYPMNAPFQKVPESILKQVEESFNGNKKNFNQNANNPKMDVSVVVEKCKQISNHKTDNGKSLRDLQKDLITTIVLMYEVYRGISSGADNETDFFSGENKNTEVIMNIVLCWLKSPKLSPFPFHDYFPRSIISQLQTIFHQSLRSGTAVDWLQQYMPEDEIELSMPSKVYPLPNFYPTESVKLDLALGRLLQLFSKLLDPNLILQCLDDSQASSIHFSWNIIMDHFEMSSSLADHNTSQQWPLPRVLNAMMVMFQLDQVESCLNIGEHVPIDCVMRSVLRLKAGEDKKSQMCLLYFDKLPEARLQKALESKEVFQYALQTFEMINTNVPHVSYKCDCGFPLHQVLKPVLYPHVGYSLLSKLWKDDQEQTAFDLCHNVPRLWSQLLMLRRSEGLDMVLPLVLHLGDYNEIKHRQDEFSTASWQLTLQLSATLQGGSCLSCGSSIPNEHLPSKIPWPSMAALLLETTNPKFTLSLLAKYSHLQQPGDLELRFYQSCLLTTLVEKEGRSRTLLKAVIEDGTSKPALSPSLAEKLDFTHHHGKGSGTTATSTATVGHHWGIQLQLKYSNCVCLCCLLPLNSPLLIQEGGIIGFYCGHAFHTACLQHKSISNCPVCMR